MYNVNCFKCRLLQLIVTPLLDRALLLWTLSLASVAILASTDPDLKQSNNASSSSFDKEQFASNDRSLMEIPENKSLHYNSTEMTYLVASTTNEPGNSTANPGLPLFCYYLPSLLYGLSGGAFAVFALSFSYLGDLAAREPSTRLRR